MELDFDKVYLKKIRSKKSVLFLEIETTRVSVEKTYTCIITYNSDVYLESCTYNALYL